MEKYQLKAQKRTVQGRKVAKLRTKGILPANIYGKKIKSQSVQIDVKEFEKLYSKAGESSLVELNTDKSSHPVLIHNVQMHPVSGNPIHVDFFEVDLKEKVTARVPVVFTGEAIAVKDKVGVLLNLLSEIEVQALPTDLPDKIELDISKLASLDQAIKVSDIKLSDKVTVLTGQDQDIVKVAPLVSKEAEKQAKEDAAAAAAAAAPSAEKPEEGKEGSAQQPAPTAAVPEVKPTAPAATEKK